MRVFVFGTRGFPKIQGGVEKHCEHLYPLIDSNDTITVFRRKSYVKTTQEYDNIHFVDLPSTKIKGFEAFFHSFLCTVYSIIKRPDIVHIHNIGPAIFTPLLRLFGLKVVLTYHSPNYEHDKWNRFAKILLKLAERWSLNYANRIIFINEKQMRKFNDTVISKSELIPNGIHVLPRITTEQFVKELGLEPYKYILTVGRITQEKGFDYLIDSFNEMNKEDVKLVIAGGIDHKSNYAKKILKKESPNVVFAGYVEGDKLRELYSFAKLFVLPSFNEGYPLVLIEAVNYKLPILASDISANRLIKLPEQRYFPVGSTVALKEKMLYQLSLPDTIVEYSHINLETWSDIARKVSDLYLKVLKK